MEAKIETTKVKVELEFTKPFYESLKDFVKNSLLTYDLSEFIEEATRIHFQNMTRGR